MSLLLLLYGVSGSGGGGSGSVTPPASIVPPPVLVAAGGFTNAKSRKNYPRVQPFPHILMLEEEDEEILIISKV